MYSCICVNIVIFITMKIGTVNINGFVDSSTKRSLILKLIGEQNLDIICLQETNFNNSDNLNEIF